MKTDDLFLKTLMKPSEASAHFNIPLSTLYFWHEMGCIDCIKMGHGCLRIFSRSLEEFIGQRSAARPSGGSGGEPGTS